MDDWICVQSPGVYTTTTGTVLVFKSSATQILSFCDTYFDDVFFLKGVTTTVGPDIKYIGLILLAPITSCSSVIISCDEITRQRNELRYRQTFH